MNEWIDYLSPTSLLKSVCGIASETSVNKDEKKGNDVDERLKDIAKQVDQLVYDADEVPFYFNEAGKIIFLEDLSDKTIAEDSSIAAEISYHFLNDTKKDCLFDDINYHLDIDTERNNFPETIRQQLGDDTEEITSMLSVQSDFGTDLVGNSFTENIGSSFKIKPDERSLASDVSDVVNKILMENGRLDCFEKCLSEDGLEPNQENEIPIPSSNQESAHTHDERASTDVQQPMYSTKYVSENLNLGNDTFRTKFREPKTSSKCSNVDKLETSSKKAGCIYAFSSTPDISISRKVGEKSSKSSSAKNLRFNWIQWAQLLCDYDLGLGMNKDIYTYEPYEFQNHSKGKVGKCFVKNNKTVALEQDIETIKIKSEASPSATNEQILSSECVEKSYDSLRNTFSQEQNVIYPIVANVIFTKEADEEGCDHSKTKSLSEPKILFSTFKVNREPTRESSRFSNLKCPLKAEISCQTPQKATDYKESCFDWGKWLDAYASDDEDRQPLPKFRVTKRHHRPKSICSNFLKCFCISTEKRRK